MPDATELMNRAFAAFAYTLEGGGAALVANVPYAASREAALAVVDAAPRVAEAAPTAASRSGSSRCWRWPSGSRSAEARAATAPKAEVVKMVPAASSAGRSEAADAVSENEATFDESDTDEEELFDDSEEDDEEDDEPRAVR